MSEKTKEMMPVEGLCFLDDNNKAYVAVCKDSCTKDKAITVANRYFKTKKDLLKIQSGQIMSGGVLNIGCKGDTWVISKKEVRK